MAAGAACAFKALTVTLREGLESFQSCRQDLDPPRKSQVLPNYLSILTAHSGRKMKHYIIVKCKAIIVQQQLQRGQSLDLLVKSEWFQRDEGNDSITQGFTEGTQILSVLQVDYQLGVESVPGCVLDSLKISGTHRARQYSHDNDSLPVLF